MEKYRKRIVDEILKRKLKGKGAILIEGPKWCGKTTTAEQASASVLYLDDPGAIKRNLALSEINPTLLLDGANPRLIDEWQLAPNLWDAIRFYVDHHQGLGQFILTGSAVPIDSDATKHSGTGRFGFLTMRPMTLYESGDSSGTVSLTKLFEGKQGVGGLANIGLERLAFLICRGGWPKSLEMEDEIALDQAYDYVDAVARTDINRVDGVKKNLGRVKRLMRSYARNQGTQASNGTLARDMSGSSQEITDDRTVAAYVDALSRLFVIEEMPAWNPNLRSKTAVRTSDTRYFIDPSIAAASLGVGPKDLLRDLRTFGFLFETLCARDLRVYAQILDGTVYHYRDKDGLECDAVIHLKNGKYGLIESKLGGDTLIEEGAKNLKALQAKINAESMSEPSFLMVVTGVGDFAYQRSDGIYVVPIGALKD